MWEDETTNEKNITCKIKKATPDIFIDPEGIDNITESKVIPLTFRSNVSGIITIKSSNSKYAVASVDNHIVVANKIKIINIKVLSQNVPEDTQITITFTPGLENINNYYNKSIVFKFNKTTIKKVQKPTEDVYCNQDLIYNNTEQILVKNAATGFEFTNKEATNAGEHIITASLKHGYVWEDNTNEPVKLTCSIKKATPKVIINNTETLYKTKSITTNIITNVSGKINVVTDETYLNVLSNQNQLITENVILPIKIFGKEVSDKPIPLTITLSPTDETNYFSTITMYYVTINSNIFELKYDTNGGNNCNPSKKTIILDKPYGTLCTPVKPNYTFDGWYTKKDAGTLVNKNTITTVGDKIIYAKWKVGKYKLIYNNNGGSGCTSQEVTYKEPYGTLCTPSRTGYIFEGWYTKPNAGNKVTSDTITTSGNNIIYARWKAKYSQVYFNQQNATKNGTTSITAIYGNAMPQITIPVKKYTITYIYGNGTTNATTNVSHQFAGYYSEKDGKGKQYYTSFGNSARKWDQESYTTLYAKWISPTITLPSPTRTGYALMGWYNSKGEKVGEAGQAYTSTTSERLTARWNKIEYKIMLEQNNATKQGPTSVKAYYGNNLPPVQVPVRKYLISYIYNNGNQNTSIYAGYDFEGYYLNIYDSKTQYYSKVGMGIKKWDITSTVNNVLHSKWIPNPTTLPAPTKEGNVFKGWYTSQTGGTKVGDAGSRYMPTKNITLYARWQPNQYTVTLNQQHATTSRVISVRATYGSILPTVAIPLRRYTITYYPNNGEPATTNGVSYKFEGYYSSPGGIGTQYYDGSGKGIKVWDKLANATLYPKWKAEYVTLPSPTKEGYRFKGWYTSQTGGTKVGIAGTRYMPTSTIRLYGQWEK